MKIALLMNKCTQTKVRLLNIVKPDKTKLNGAKKIMFETGFCPYKNIVDYLYKNCIVDEQTHTNQSQIATYTKTC